MNRVTVSVLVVGVVTVAVSNFAFLALARVLPTPRRAFQTQGLEHRFHQRQSRGRRGIQGALSRGAYRHDTSCGLFHLSEVSRKCASNDLLDQLGGTSQSLLQAHLLMCGAMPSPASVVYLLGSVAKEKTEGTYARRLPYFWEWKIK